MKTAGQPCIQQRRIRPRLARSCSGGPSRGAARKAFATTSVSIVLPSKRSVGPTRYPISHDTEPDVRIGSVSPRHECMKRTILDRERLGVGLANWLLMSASCKKQLWIRTHLGKSDLPSASQRAQPSGQALEPRFFQDQSQYEQPTLHRGITSQDVFCV